MLFREGHPGFGIATLVLPFVPATAASLVFLKRKKQQEEDEEEDDDEDDDEEEEEGNTCLTKLFMHLSLVEEFFERLDLNPGVQKFLKHLPGVQIWTHQKMLRRVAKLQNEISEDQEKINQLKKEVQTEETKEDIAFYEKRILKNENKINKIKTELQRFKIFAAVFESLPQFILQCSILVKRIYADEVIELNDPIFWMQTSSSIVSVFLTFTGLVCEMPVLVYKTERPPIRNLAFTYTKVLPLVVVGAAPQLFTLIGLGSFLTFQDMLFYIPYGLVYLGLLGTGSIAIKCWMKKNYPVIAEKSSVSTLIDLGLIIAVICPSIIGVFGSEFLLMTSLSTTTIHSVAIGALCLFGKFQPNWVFHSNLTNNQTQNANLNITESHVEEEQYDTIFGYLQWYTLILIPMLLLFANFIAAWGKQKVFMAMNDLYRTVIAIDESNIQFFQDEPTMKKNLKELLPGDEGNNTLFHYCTQRNDEFSAQLIDICDDQELDLIKENNKNKTALMIACDKAHPKTVQSIFNKASEGMNIGVNKTERYGDSALHFAVLSNGPIEAKKKIITLFWSYANQLEINLRIKNKEGQTPIDLMKEGVESKGWLKELGNPIEDLKLLHPLKKAIEEGDFDQVESIKSKFIMNLGFVAVFHAIREDEEFAIAMIDNCQRLTLSLSETNEDKNTPLIRACQCEKPKIAKAILCQAKVQDIAINAKSMQGGFTAFNYACYWGLTDVVAIMLEMAQEVKIDLNARDNLKRSGFILACRNKHSEVINLIMAKAESLQIDLHCKDDDGKSGFDYYPEHFQNDKVLVILQSLYDSFMS